MRRILSLLFGCPHQHISWPQGKEHLGLTVECFDCMKRLPYDWREMRIGSCDPKPVSIVEAKSLL